MRELSQMLERLSAAKLEFVVVGGFAAVAHGVSLTTRDLDICCRFTVENLQVLWDAVRDLHPKHRMTPQRIPLNLSPESCVGLRNLYLETDLCILDCLSEVKDVSIEIELPFAKVGLLGIDGLIQAKKAIGRPHDQITVVQLEAIKEKLKPDT